MDSWKVVVGTARGVAHRDREMPNQDAAEYRVDGPWMTAVLCDGAGSATKSDLGAQHGARVVSGRVMERVAAMSADAPQGEWESAVAGAIEEARALLVTEQAEAGDLRPYHATLVGVVAGPDRGLFFHIGDGLGTASKRGDWERCVLSAPSQGEFADLTFFYTLDSWREHLRFTPFSTADVDLVTLMSDGAMTFAASQGARGLAPEFIVPVSNYLAANDAKTGAAALCATLDSPKTYGITGDDKTLVWAHRQP